MGSRGRKSTAEKLLEVQTRDPLVAPAPDPILPDGAQYLWNAIIASRDKGFFTVGDLPLLREYCLNCATLLPTLDKRLLEAGTDKTLLKMRDDLVRQSKSLATALRINVSSRTRPDTAAMRDSTFDGPPPWEYPGRG